MDQRRRPATNKTPAMRVRSGETTGETTRLVGVPEHWSRVVSIPAPHSGVVAPHPRGAQPRQKGYPTQFVDWQRSRGSPFDVSTASSLYNYPCPPMEAPRCPLAVFAAASALPGLLPSPQPLCPPSFPSPCVAVFAALSAEAGGRRYHFGLMRRMAQGLSSHWKCFIVVLRL